MGTYLVQSSDIVQRSGIDMKVAVVIPCYNVEDYVEAAVRSVWAQKGVELDIVAVDDGSTDGTGQVLAALASERPGQLKVITQTNRGACLARQRGMGEVGGAYIQFLDADDRLLEGKIARQVGLAQAAGGPALVVGGYRNQWQDGRQEDVIPTQSAPWSAWISARLGTTSANLWQRTAIEAVGGWKADQASSQDYELSHRLLKDGHGILLDPIVGALITKRSIGSISRTDAGGNLERYIRLRAHVRDHLRTCEAHRFARELNLVEQQIFLAIRALYRIDSARAEELLAVHVPPGFKPVPAPGLSNAYCLVHRLLGFSAAEVVASAIGNLRRIRNAHDTLP